MRSGIVVGLQARIELILRPPGSADVEIECVIDTGFEGTLTLPPARVIDLGLPYLTRIAANLADGSRIWTNVHTATVIWQSREREIAVLAMGRHPLLGTLLLEDCHLSIDFYEGGTVLVDDIL